MKPRKEHYRGKLPHFQQPGQWYSVTCVLNGAIPKGALDKYSIKLEAAKNSFQNMVQKQAGQGLSQVPDLGIGLSHVSDRGVGNSPSREPDFPKSGISDLGKSESRESEFPNSGMFDLGKSNSQLTKARKEYYIALRKYRLAYDKVIHNSKQPTIDLTKDNNRKIIEEALLFWEGKKLQNHAWCIMSNHFHWILSVFERERELEFPNSNNKELDFPNSNTLTWESQSPTRESGFPKSDINKPIYLQDILHSVKLFTARRINKNENRTGQLWEHESFDTTIRNEKHFTNSVRYVIQNPVFANFVNNWRDWPAKFLEAGLEKSI